MGLLQQAEAGVASGELCRQQGFRDASFYTLRAKFRGMSVPEVKRPRKRKAEKAQIKCPLAESMLDAKALQAASG